MFIVTEYAALRLAESRHVKMPHCWKSHATAQIIALEWQIV